MQRPLTWSQLKIGIASFLVIAGAVIAVLMFARVGALHGDQVRLYLVTNDAGQVIKGTEVWLGGRQIGVVDGVRFRPADSDTSERLLVEMRVLSQYLPQLRRNSDVQIRPGSSLIGETVVSISVGTSAGAAIHEDDTLRAQPVMAEHKDASDVTALGDSVVAVAGTIRQLAADVRATSRQVAQLRQRSERQAAHVGRAIDAFSDRAMRSHGTLARVLGDTASGGPGLHAAFLHVQAQSDSIRQLLASPNHSLGRFRRDSTLITTATHVLASADSLRARFSVSPLARPDSALPRQLDRVRTQLDSLIHDVKHHPLKYLSL